jgi:hypothetical protein
MPTRAQSKLPGVGPCLSATSFKGARIGADKDEARWNAIQDSEVPDPGNKIIETGETEKTMLT